MDCVIGAAGGRKTTHIIGGHYCVIPNGLADIPLLIPPHFLEDILRILHILYIRSKPGVEGTNMQLI